MTQFNLREARDLRGITQVELAEKSRIDQTYISLIERGLRMPSDEIKKRLAKALRLRPVRLRFESPQPDATVNAEGDRSGHEQSHGSSSYTTAERG